MRRYYRPACLVINYKGDIIYSHEKMQQYLSSRALKTSSNIHKFFGPKANVQLSNAIRKAVLGQNLVACRNITIKQKGLSALVNIQISPLSDYLLIPNLLLVTFEDAIQTKRIAGISKKYDSNFKMHNQIIKLEQELRYTKHHLQESIEELQSSNEELQSTNEELQSTNEEIETSKEELQSVNEELVMVNAELQSRIDELALAKQDMSNLFDRLDIAAILIDKELRIKRFTFKTQEFINLIKSDIGRSIKSFNMTLRYERFIENIEEVIKSHVEKCVEIQSQNNKWYSIRILPYQIISTEIEGIVILFTDITPNIITHEQIERDLKEINQALEGMLIFTENVLDTMNKPLIVLSSEYRVVSANRSFYNLINMDATECVGMNFLELQQNQFNTKKVVELLNDTLTNNRPVAEYELKLKFTHLGQRKIILNTNRISSKMLMLSMELIPEL